LIPNIFDRRISMARILRFVFPTPEIQKVLGYFDAKQGKRTIFDSSTEGGPNWLKGEAGATATYQLKSCQIHVSTPARLVGTGNTLVVVTAEDYSLLADLFAAEYGHLAEEET
jgi:hypothetical protein